MSHSWMATSSRVKPWWNVKIKRYKICLTKSKSRRRWWMKKRLHIKMKRIWWRVRSTRKSNIWRSRSEGIEKSMKKRFKGKLRLLGQMKLRRWKKRYRSKFNKYRSWNRRRTKEIELNMMKLSSNFSLLRLRLNNWRSNLIRGRRSSIHRPWNWISTWTLLKTSKYCRKNSNIPKSNALISKVLSNKRNKEFKE